MGVIACTRCTKVWPVGTGSCDRCGSKIVARDTKSLQHVWALWLVGLMCYVPANAYPMLQTRTLLSVQEDTIVGGAIESARASLLSNASFVWIIRILALAIALGVAWQSYDDRGPLIEIEFENSAGISKRETELRYRDVAVCVVEDVKFASDLSGV